MRILGVDFGEKRIGLAVSDPLGFTAQQLDTLIRQNKNQVMQTIARLCEEYGVEELVMGLPVNMDGSHGPKAQEVLKWATELGARLNVPVKTWDERLTSRQAGRLMIEQGLSRQKQKERSDRLAALLILQSYLDSKRKEGVG